MHNILGADYEWDHCHSVGELSSSQGETISPKLGYQPLSRIENLTLTLIRYKKHTLNRKKHKSDIQAKTVKG